MGCMPIGAEVVHHIWPAKMILLLMLPARTWFLSTVIPAKAGIHDQ